MCGTRLYGCIGCRGYGPHSLVKRRDHNHRIPMTIAAPSGPFNISQRQLAHLHPTALRRAQVREDRVLGPEHFLNQTYDSLAAREDYGRGIEWLKTLSLGFPMRCRPSLMYNGDNYDNEFDLRIDNMREAWRRNDELTFKLELRELLGLLQGLGNMFGPSGGVGPGLYSFVREKGLETAALVAFDPKALFYLIYFLWRIIGDDEIVRRMVHAIPMQNQADLEQVAYEACIMDGWHPVADIIFDTVEGMDRLTYSDMHNQLLAARMHGIM